MSGLRIALVGKSVTDNEFIARELLRMYKFSDLRMIKPVRRLKLLLYGRTTNIRWNAVTLYRYYDTLYSLNKQNFLLNLDSRLPYVKKPDIVVPDARYVNEVIGLADRGFTIVRVVSEYTRKPRMTDNLQPGSVTLYEHFAASQMQEPYHAYYQLVRYKDFARTRAGIVKFMETMRLNFPEQTFYTDNEDPNAGPKYYQSRRFA